MKTIDAALSGLQTLPATQRRVIAPAAEPGTLPGPLVEPKMSYRLDHAVRQILNPHPDAGAGKEWAADVQAEARRVLDVLGPRFRTVKVHTVRKWASLLGTAVRNPPSADDLSSWCAALAFACHDIPESMFTETTQRAALLKFTFWPSVADVVALLAPDAGRLRSRLTALRTIAEGKTAEPPKPRPAGPAPVPAWVHDRTSRHLGAAEPGEIDAAALDAEAALSRAKQLDALKAMMAEPAA